MAISAKVVTISCPASTGAQATTGVGFVPKCLIAVWSKQTANGSAVDYDLGYGFAGAGPTFIAQNGSAQDNVAPSNSDRTFSNAAFIRHRNHNDTVIFAATVTSYNADGFTLNWSAVTSGVDVHILCLGGSDLTNAVCGTFQKPNGTTGNQAVTGLGFSPDAVFFACNEDNSAAASSLTGDLHGIGAMTSTGQWVSVYQTRTALASTRTNRYQRTDQCIAFFNEGSQVIAGEASAVSLDADGFTVNWTISDAQQSYQGYLALEFTYGFACAIGADTQKTSTGTKATTNVGVTPVALFLTSFCNASTNAVVANNRHAIGVATSPTARGSVWGGSSDTVATTISDQDSDTTKVLKMMTEGTPTTEAAADLSSFDTGGFTLNWTAADATARQFVFAAFGPTPPPVPGAAPPMWFG